MELAFDKLNSLAYTDFKPESGCTQPAGATLTAQKEPEKSPPVDISIEGLGALQRIANTNKAERTRLQEAYSYYQENIKRSGELRTQLLKGVQVGEDIYSLFLKATEAISKMIDNPLFYSQIAEDLKAIYGAGLLQKPPLQMKLQDAQERLQRLIEAEQRDVEPEDKERIQRAIKAHKEEIAQLEATIAR